MWLFQCNSDLIDKTISCHCNGHTKLEIAEKSCIVAHANEGLSNTGIAMCTDRSIQKASRLKSRKSFMCSHAARLVCEQQQTAALERQPDRRASLRQNGTGGGRVFAGWTWRTGSVGVLSTYSDRAGKGMRPQVGENCVKDTTEEVVSRPFSC